MELFTEIEFNNKEFDKIEKVLSTLINEGWVNYHSEINTIKSYNNIIEIKTISEKYYFKRIL